MIKFWWRSGSRIRIRISTLVRRALEGKCTVPVLLVNNELLRYLLDHHLIAKKQYGFSFTNLLECLADWTLNLRARRFTAVVCFNFIESVDTAFILRNIVFCPPFSVNISANIRRLR